MVELLLGRPHLKSIGFDFKELLVRAPHHIHDKDISELHVNILKISAAKKKSLANQHGGDGPIQIHEVLSTCIGLDTKKSIDQAFDKLINDGKMIDITEKGCSRLVSYFKSSAMCSLPKIGTDTTEKVSPLVITRGDKGHPFRSNIFRYAPQQ